MLNYNNFSRNLFETKSRHTLCETQSQALIILHIQIHLLLLTDILATYCKSSC